MEVLSTLSLRALWSVAFRTSRFLLLRLVLGEGFPQVVARGPLPVKVRPAHVHQLFSTHNPNRLHLGPRELAIVVGRHGHGGGLGHIVPAYPSICRPEEFLCLPLAHSRVQDVPKCLDVGIQPNARVFLPGHLQQSFGVLLRVRDLSEMLIQRDDLVERKDDTLDVVSLWGVVLLLDLLGFLSIVDRDGRVVRDGEVPPLVQVGDVPSVWSSAEQLARSCPQSHFRVDHAGRILSVAAFHSFHWRTRFIGGTVPQGRC